VKTLDLLGLDDGGALHHNPVAGIVVELWSPLVSSSVSGGKLWFF
jgi:hypothetical protein